MNDSPRPGLSPALVRLLGLLVALLVALVVVRFLIVREERRRGIGCMAECPAPPTGCERTSVDPGACADSKCTTPAPVCHYGPTDAGAVCPPTLAGRCIAP